MYHLRIKIITVIALLVVSCGFIDLRPIEVTSSPAEPDAVLSDHYSPLHVWFNTGMLRTEAENLLLVSSDTGIVEGERFWDGNTLVFIPVAGWSAGTRYVMGLSGMARSIDGREIRMDRTIPFFAINRSAPPCIVRHNPADGESVSTQGLSLEIHFSRAMDRASVESALNIEGMADKTLEWSGDDTILTLTPEKTLAPWILYRWTLRSEAKCAQGVPLARAVSASFITDLDRLMPEVLGVYPVMPVHGMWVRTGGSLEEDLGPGLAIAVEFNKPMPDAAFRLLRFEPSLSGRTERLSEQSMVFIPSRNPEPHTVYTLIISGDTQDREGLKIGSDYRRFFVADIPFLDVLSVQSDQNTIILPQDRQVMQVPVSESDGGLVRFDIHFSLPFTEEAQQQTVLAISLLPFFPGNLAPIAVRFASWLSDDRLRMEWEGLQPGSGDETHYYRLLLPGGRAGIHNGGGMYCRDNLSLYLEAVQ